MSTPNTYIKYAPNVYLAKCTEKHDKGDELDGEDLDVDPEIMEGAIEE